VDLFKLGHLIVNQIEHSKELRNQRNKVIFAGICSMILTVGIARFAYTPLLPLMLEETALTKLFGGWLATFNYIGYLAGALLAASLKELSVKFYLYRLYLLLAAITTYATGLTDNQLAWTILRFISGVSSTAGLLLASGLVINWLRANSFKPQLGVHFIGMGVGIVFTGLITALLADKLLWDAQWQYLGLFGCIFLIPAWFWMPYPEKFVQNSSSAVEQPSSRFMKLFIATYFCAGVGYVISATFIVDILEKTPQLTGKGGWVWVIVGISAAPSAILWDKIANRIGQIQALQLAYLIEIISFVLPLTTENSTFSFIASIFWGATFGGIVSLTLAIVGRAFPANPAKAMAKLTISFGVAQIVAPIFAGYIADATGTYLWALIIATLVMLAGMIFLHKIGYEVK
jgi:predicted MFS family arabinose efflux permease